MKSNADGTMSLAAHLKAVDAMAHQCKRRIARRDKTIAELKARLAKYEPEQEEKESCPT